MAGIDDLGWFGRKVQRWQLRKGIEQLGWHGPSVGTIVHAHRPTHDTPFGAGGIWQRHAAFLGDKPLRALGFHQCGALLTEAFLLGLGKDNNLLRRYLVTANAGRVICRRCLILAGQTRCPSLLRSLARRREVPRGVRDTHR